ncbi:MAG: peptide chain release factor N(5)-glutamine methyltransferase [Oscillospiraceae bacterium]
MRVYELISAGNSILKNENIENYEFETDVLFSKVMGKHRLSYPRDYDVSDDLSQNFLKLVEKRSTHYPLQYICQSWGFRNLDLAVGEGVLIPRQDTETVVECALKCLENIENPKVLDLCAGTGAIALAVFDECKNAQVTAVEKYENAYKYLEINAKGKITAVCGDIFDFCDTLCEGEFDLIISNPPYVTQKEMGTLEKELSFEPSTALTDGGDGLSFYRFIAEKYKFALKKGGALVFEIGASQTADVCEILSKEKYCEIFAFNDLAGLPRCVTAKR